MERWATQAVGVPVKLGAIRVHTDPATPQGTRFIPSLFPAFELQDVRLFDPSGREALHLPSVQAAISALSLWRLGFEQIVIDGPVLDVRRTAQGRLEVAGLDLFAESSGESGAADWFFSQGEFAIRRGTVRWTDELRGQPPLALSELDFVARNSRREHALRLDATPPPDWGQRLSLRAQLREPLLDLLHLGPDPQPWKRWSGELYADFPDIDLARLRPHLPLPEAWGELRSGQGRLQAWADLERGELTGATADLALTGLALRWPRLPELALTEVSGRLNAGWNAEGFDLRSERLRLRTANGLDWAAGNGRLRHQLARGQVPASTEAQIDRLDLDTLAALAARLPLPPAARQWLSALQPGGRVEALSLRFEGLPPARDTAAGVAAPAEAPAWWPERYRASARLMGLNLQAQAVNAPADGSRPPLGRPGIEGLNAQLELHQDGGHASLNVAQGAVVLPGVFERARIPLERLSAEARWRIAGERIDVWLDPFSLANADAEGSGQVHWHTSDPATSPSRSRFPGVLDLSARLTRGEARQVHHYLPLSIGNEARRYVREAAQAGSVGPVDFRIQGDLWDLPYNLPGTEGEFRITAALRGVDFQYVPGFLQAPDDRAWPGLRGVNGQLVLDRVALSVSGLEAGLQGSTGLRLRQAEVQIPNLMDPVLQARAEVQGPGAELLTFIQRSPVNDLTSQALDRATLTGPAQGRFALRLQLFALATSTVQGSLQLAGNDVQISPESPLLANASGEVGFSERGFSVSQARAQVFGGELRFEGGMQTPPQGAPRIRFRGEGVASAEGLQRGGLGLASGLFAQARGFTSYSAELGFRAGQPELTVTSQLQGLALDLPAPLNKPAGDRLPLRYDNSVLSTRSEGGSEAARTDRLAITLGPSEQPLVLLDYERELGAAEPRVLRGRIAVGLTGDETVGLPSQGVHANARLGQLDVDAWDKVFTAALNAGSPAAGNPPRAGANTRTDGTGLDYLPTTLGLRAGRLQVGGRSFNDIVIGGQRDGTQWRANLDADELNGYIEYRQATAQSAGHVHARLA
ncbi:MAG: TIGR02099 family protein, partial [Hydrogenophaga sp.]|nr:TIGR02099 family protein [Hydrogenophaga sp.]